MRTRAARRAPRSITASGPIVALASTLASFATMAVASTPGDGTAGGKKSVSSTINARCGEPHSRTGAGSPRVPAGAMNAPARESRAACS